MSKESRLPGIGYLNLNLMMISENFAISQSTDAEVV